MPSRNHKTLACRALVSVRSPLRPCHYPQTISDLHLRDLEIILPTCLPQVEEGCQARINFTGCAALASWMENIVGLKTPNSSGIHDPKSLGFLQTQLDSIEVTARANDELTRLSRDLMEKEKKMRVSRERAIEAVGL
jgi:hypothetical protein